MICLFDGSCLLAGLRWSLYTFDLPRLYEDHGLCFHEPLLFLDLVLQAVDTLVDHQAFSASSVMRFDSTTRSR